MHKKSVWISYAWKDNNDQDVDYIAQVLREKGLEVRFDRVRLQSGQRLWEQIDQNINDQSLDGWVLLVTENSLRSEPCQEELAYALDRTLRTRGQNWPMIGLFPQPIDRSLIPSAIATRLYVELSNNDWADQIIAGISHSQPLPSSEQLLPFGMQVERTGTRVRLEVWPRTGTWTNFGVAVKTEDLPLLKGVTPGGRGSLPRVAMVMGSSSNQGDVTVRKVQGPFTSSHGIHVVFDDTLQALSIAFEKDGTWHDYNVDVPVLLGA